MSIRILNEDDRAIFRAMWNSKRTCKAIAERLRLTVKQVKEMRPALGLPRRNQGGTVRLYTQVHPEVKAKLTARAKELGVPRQRYLAIVLEREVRGRL